MNQKATTTIQYFLYARKSSESDERQIQSIDDQVHTMQGVANNLGLNVVRIFTESKSAKEPHARPVFEEMIARLSAGEANGIVTWKIDRLSRNPIDSATIQWMLQQDTLKAIQTIGRVYYPDDNTLILSVESSMANQYIRDLSKNVKRGLQSKLDKGWMPGTAPLGYVNTKTAARGDNTILTDPERFSLLRQAWDLMLTGHYTPPQILDRLNNVWGFRTRPWQKKGGKPMSRSTIYRIFTNPFYAGILPYKGLHLPGKHPAMVTLDEFDRVQILLGRKGKPRPNRYQYAYTGVMTCGECGGFVSATCKEKILRSTGTRKTYILYYCARARKQRGACAQRYYTNAEIIEAQLAHEIAQLTILPAFKDWALTVLAEQHTKAVEEQAKRAAMHRKALNDTQRQLDNLTGLRLRDLIDDVEYIREKTRLQNDMTHLTRRLMHTEERPDAWRQLTRDAFEFACAAREAFLTGDADTKKTIVSAIGVNCTLKEHSIALQSPEWLIPIKTQYPLLARHIAAFELTNHPFTEPQKAAFAAYNPEVRALVDAVGTVLRRHNGYICNPKTAATANTLVHKHCLCTHTSKRC